MKARDHNFNPITAAQSRAARALLNITQDDLADLSGVSKATIADFEREGRNPQRRTLKDLRAAFEARGVVFLADSGGVGVYLRADATPASEGPAAG